MFSMGLYSKKLRIPFLKPIHNFFIKLLVKNINQVLFLGKGEYNKAMNTHQKLYNKFFYFPFSIDTKFWGEDVISSNEKNGSNSQFKVQRSDSPIDNVGKDLKKNQNHLAEIRNQYDKIF